MKIETTEFERNYVNTYNKISFNGKEFHAVYRLLPGGKSLKFSDESDEALVILNRYSLSEIMYLNISELMFEIKRLAEWGLFLGNKDELLLAYAALMENNNNATDYLINKEETSMNTTTTFESVQVGDKLWSVLYGWGEVSEVAEGNVYPLMVLFSAGVKRRYTFEGKQFKNHVSQTLFWDEVKIEAPQKPLPDLEVDTKVIVWNNIIPKTKRHFSHFSSSGEIVCFASGMTSWSTKQTVSYSHWELAE